MANVIVKHHPSGGPVDLLALVDGPTYDSDPHIITGLENVPNVDTTNASNITSGTLPIAQLPFSLLDEPVIVTGASSTISAKTGSIAINRAAPSTTNLALPTVAAQRGIPLRIIDWSTSITQHIIILTPASAETIMKSLTWSIYSNPASLGSLTLYPSTILNGWYISP